MAMHSTAILAEENGKLCTGNQHQKQKQQDRQSYIAHGGLYRLKRQSF
jgi:hypothetical protein